MKHFVILAASCCLLLPSGSSAQQTVAPDAWRAVSARSAGDVLKIKLKNSKTIMATLKTASDTGLVLELKDKELALEKNEINSVSVLTKKSAGKAALVGMVVGGGVGAGAGAGLGAAHSNNCFCTHGQGVAIGAGVLGGAGAAAGGLVGLVAGHASRKETLLYQAKTIE